MQRRMPRACIERDVDPVAAVHPDLHLSHRAIVGHRSGELIEVGADRPRVAHVKRRGCERHHRRCDIGEDLDETRSASGIVPIGHDHFQQACTSGHWNCDHFFVHELGTEAETACGGHDAINNHVDLLDRRTALRRQQHINRGGHGHMITIGRAHNRCRWRRRSRHGHQLRRRPRRHLRLDCLLCGTNPQPHRADQRPHRIYLRGTVAEHVATLQGDASTCRRFPTLVTHRHLRDHCDSRERLLQRRLQVPRRQLGTSCWLGRLTRTRELGQIQEQVLGGARIRDLHPLTVSYRFTCRGGRQRQHRCLRIDNARPHTTRQGLITQVVSGTQIDLEEPFDPARHSNRPGCRRRQRCRTPHCRRWRR